MQIVSIIIPSYNHDSYIEETIESCLNQDYVGPIEIIVVDDASTDETKKILSERNFQIDSNRSLEIIYKNANKGINDSISRALSVAKGSYIQLLASDDILCPSKISKQAEFLENSAYDSVYSRGFILEAGKRQQYYLTDFKQAVEQGKTLEFISTKDWGLPLIQSGLFEKEVLLDLQEVRKQYKSDDWAMLISLFTEHNPGYYDEPLIIYRLHGNNSHKKYWSTFPMRIDIVSRLIDPKFRAKAFSNILLSQADYLSVDHNRIDSLKFFLASTIFGFSSPKMRARVLTQIIFPAKIISKLKKTKNALSHSK